MERTDPTHAIDMAPLPAVKQPITFARMAVRKTLLNWFSTSWEIYPVLLVATFLRFYQLAFTEFDTDQAVLWNMTRVALTHGLIPANGNLASIGIVNPPAFIYILMIVAVFTNNPLAGAGLMAALNVLAVLLTYLFTRRYYGRLAAFVAASLTATATVMLQYSRFIWQPNILAPLMVLYMLVLFRGAVARRTGWFAPALFLLGLSIQLSGSSIYLAPALVVALVLGYKTVRWRDLLLGALLFALLFSTYLVWEAASGYADIPLLLGASSQHALVDGQALGDYLRFLSSYGTPPTDPHLLFTKLVPLMALHRLAMLVLICASFALLLLGLFWERVQLTVRGATELVATSVPVSASASLWQQLWERWNAFIASPQRRGVLLLLTWQLLPLLLLSRHSISLQVHYFLMLMPGPFILIGLLVSQATAWGSLLPDLGKMVRVLIPVLAVGLILTQTLGSLAWVLDLTGGNQLTGTNYNTLQDLQLAMQAADQLARKHHFRHIYIDTDARTVDALNYLAGQTQIANTLLNKNNSHCLLLPTVSQGPAVMLFGPTETLDEALLKQYTSATLVSEPSRLGGAPFHLYIVQPVPAAPTTNPAQITRHQKRPFVLVVRNTGVPSHPLARLLATFWHSHTQRLAHVGSWYTYHFAATYSGNGTNGESGTADCLLTSLMPGEQLLVPFSLSPGSQVLPSALAINGTITSNTPYVLNYGPLHFQTLREQSVRLATFQGTTQGGQF